MRKEALVPGAAGPLWVGNDTDAEGNPTGGFVRAKGIDIGWQNGPRAESGSQVLAEANGAFVEDVIEAARQRLEYFQGSKFACTENALAIGHLKAALEWLEARTADRAARGVEGTHDV